MKMDIVYYPLVKRGGGSFCNLSLCAHKVRAVEKNNAQIAFPPLPGFNVCT